MLGITAGIDQTDILALFFDTGSCMVKAGFTTGYDTPHACSLWAVGRSVMFGIMAGMATVDPRHQGGEGVEGTPGACSQVFCHPISCT